MSKFSVVILTFNEERIIEKCILAAKEVSDDVVIIDSFSTDKTEDICKKLGVAFIQQKWLGYSEQKNFGNKHAQNNWILSLDADEILSKESIDHLKKITLTNEHEVYKICRLNNYCSVWIKHGRWYPEWRNRLFNRNLVHWNGDIVHEDLTAISGDFKKDFTFNRTKGDVFHYSMQSKSEHLEKVEQYAQLSAEKMHSKSKKASFVKRFLSPFSRFVVDYFIKLGILDGKLGFQIAYLSAFETYLKYKKLRELNLS